MWPPGGEQGDGAGGRGEPRRRSCPFAPGRAVSPHQSATLPGPPMLLQILTIARNTFVESIRQPILFVLVMICGVLQLFNTWSAAFAMGYTESGEVSGDNKMLLDIGLATV